MALTSIDIQNQSFSIDRKGYDVDEVDVFLEHVANELDGMNALIDQLQNELDDAKFGGFDRPSNSASSSNEAKLQAQLAEKDERIAELELQLEERKAEGETIAQVLITAQRSGDEILNNAKTEAAHIRQDAEDEAQRILDRANEERQKIRDAIEQLEKDREETRNNYQELLKDFIEYANKKLVEVGGDNPSSSSSSDSSSSGHVRGARAHAKVQEPLRRFGSAPAASYTTPTVTAGSVAVAATPKPSAPEKDLSGFGDADDDFEFEDID